MTAGSAGIAETEATGAAEAATADMDAETAIAGKQEMTEKTETRISFKRRS